MSGLAGAVGLSGARMTDVRRSQQPLPGVSSHFPAVAATASQNFELEVLFLFDGCWGGCRSGDLLTYTLHVLRLRQVARLSSSGRANFAQHFLGSQPAGIVSVPGPATSGPRLPSAWVPAILVLPGRALSLGWAPLSARDLRGSAKSCRCRRGQLSGCSGVRRSAPSGALCMPTWLSLCPC